MKTRIPFENGDTLAALRGFLKSLLSSKTLDLLLVPMRTPAGVIAPTLVSDPALLDLADPLAPVLPVNGATLAGKLSVKSAGAKIGVVLRACELRALVELTKMQQAKMADLTLIAVDCAGTYSVPVYRRQPNGSQENLDRLWKDLFTAAIENPGESASNLRAACKVCEQPVFENASIRIELFGSQLDQVLQISLPEETAAALELQPADGDGGRAGQLEKLVAARTAERDAQFALLRQRLEGEEGLPGVFAECIRCHNCMNVCPICYCKTCVFKSAIFDHTPAQMVNWSRQKGAYRMPSDTTLFHLTRLNHMALSCVGCGMCTEACPAELPVGMAFRAIGQRVQATFEYAPGRSLEESLPLVTFKADEWTEVGE